MRAGRRAAVLSGSASPQASDEIPGLRGATDQAGSNVGLEPRACLLAFGIWLAVITVGIGVALHVVAPQLSLREGFDRVVLNGDAGWLQSIYQHGYQWGGNPLVADNVAFLPLYPMLVWVVHAIGVPWTGAAFLVSVTCEAGMVVLLGRLMAAVGADRRQSWWAVVFALVYPAALFSVTGYGTSLLALLTVAALLSYLKGYRTLAFCCAGLATIVYYPGFAVPAALIVAEVVTLRRAALAPVALVRMVSGFGGYLGFMVYLAIKFHAPLASISDQRAWVGTASPAGLFGRLFTMSPVANGLIGVVRWPVEASTMHFFDVPFLVTLLVVAVWLLLGRHGIETWLLVFGLAIVLYQAGTADYPFAFLRLSYPFWVVLAMNGRFRALMDRVTWLGPLAVCAGVLGTWIALLPNGQYLN